MTLQQLRDEYNQRKKLACPHCKSQLTIEQTKYFKSEICENCFQHVKIDDLEGCCNAPDFHTVKYIISNGTIQVRKQCKNCGELDKKNIGGLSKEEKDVLPIANKVLSDKKKDVEWEIRKSIYDRAQAGRELYILNKKQEQKDEWFSKYNNYLNSNAWKIKRAAVLKRDKNLCQCCLDAFATQVHHKSYEFVDMNGSEPAFDLVAICKPCHDRIEEIKRNNRQAS